MKESIYTIPLMDAMKSGDECPLCFLERAAEQHAISFILGSAYMEDDIRMETDKTGFCRSHYKMMYDYGNRLGSALILSTHLHRLNQELKEEIRKFTPGKSSFLHRIKKSTPGKDAFETSMGAWASEKACSCYVCEHIEKNYSRYLDTFFLLYQSEPEFAELLENSKGFCLKHFSHLVEMGQKKLNDKQKERFYPALFAVMEKNLQRLEAEVTWFTEKYDYRNKDKDWGNSRDSIQRCMQKAAGGYPADEVFREAR